jgi:MFS transporter, DHA1 family, multidrug resistance protein
MFDGMGVQWAETLLGCVAFTLVPIPVLFYLYGHKLRAKSKFAPTMAPKKAEFEEEEESEVANAGDVALEAAASAPATKGEHIV